MSETLPPARQHVLESIKQHGPSTISELAERLEITGEAVRQHLLRLARSALVRPERKPEPGQLGRPAVRYRLTPAGEEQFPKAYAALSRSLFDALDHQLSHEAQRSVLGGLTEEKVRAWAPRLAGLDLRGKLQALRSFYLPDDPYVELGEDEQGPFLVEKNCPYLAVASERPALCGVTVNAISQLLGCKVIRELRPQAGDGRCLLRIKPDQPLEPG